MTFLRFSRNQGGISGVGRPGSSLMELISSEDWKLAQMECQLNCQEASQWVHRAGFFDGIYSSIVLPIHQACALHPPADFVKILLDAYSGGAMQYERTVRRHTENGEDSCSGF